MIWYEFGLGLWLFTYLFFITHFLFPSKKRKKLLTIANIFLFALLYAINAIYTEPLIAFTFYILLTILFLFLKCTESTQTLITLLVILYMIRFSFEVILKAILYFLNITIPSNYTMIIFTSILSSIFIFTFAQSLKEYITNPHVYKTPKTLTKSIFNNLGLLFIIMIRIPTYSSYFCMQNILNLFLFFIIFNLIFFLFQEKDKNNILNKNYQKILEYSEFTEGLLTEYKSFIHEYKNKLIIIKGMANENQKELQEYIDSILEEKAVNHYRWLTDIKNIPIAGVKGLINFKLLKMKELNIEVEVYISEDISKLKEDFLNTQEKNDLYTLLGIILDNAIEASIESKEKMISLHLYQEDENIVIVLANTFKHISIDRLEEKGFSSKGKNRGIGLYLFQQIIKHSDTFSKDTSIYDNFFVQKIIIKKCK